MNILEAHEEEDRLARRLRSLDPDNPALRYYGSTWAAIEAYVDALRHLWHKEKEVNGNTTPC